MVYAQSAGTGVIQDFGATPPPPPHPLCHMKGRSAVFTQIRVLSVIFTQIWVLSVIFTQMKVLSVIFTQMRVLSVIFTQMQVFSVVQGIQVFSCKLCEACTLLQPNPTWAGMITMVKLWPPSCGSCKWPLGHAYNWGEWTFKVALWQPLAEGGLSISLKSPSLALNFIIRRTGTLKLYPETLFEQVTKCLFAKPCLLTNSLKQVQLPPESAPLF